MDEPAVELRVAARAAGAARQGRCDHAAGSRVTGRLVVVSGLPGTGKTSVAEFIAAHGVVPPFHRRGRGVDPRLRSAVRVASRCRGVRGGACDGGAESAPRSRCRRRCCLRHEEAELSASSPMPGCSRSGPVCSATECGSTPGSWDSWTPTRRASGAIDDGPDLRATILR